MHHTIQPYMLEVKNTLRSRFFNQDCFSVFFVSTILLLLYYFAKPVQHHGKDSLAFIIHELGLRDKVNWESN